jgi:hypothetical protein
MTVLTSHPSSSQTLSVPVSEETTDRGETGITATKNHLNFLLYLNVKKESLILPQDSIHYDQKSKAFFTKKDL